MVVIGEKCASQRPLSLRPCGDGCRVLPEQDGSEPMSMTANPTAPMTRADFDAVVEPLVARVASLEDSAGRSTEPDVVTASEFRLFKWLGTFALATVVAGFGLLSEQVSDVRIGMERLHVELLREMSVLREDMQTEVAGLRDEMQSGFTSVRQEISAVRERVVRVETILVGKESPPGDDPSADPR